MGGSIIVIKVDAALKIPPPSTGLKECMSADKTIVSVADVMSKVLPDE